ncbi:neprilysin-4 [Patella vulgata]|uniref:neprilysin-4 n=1 Tax=Patella vulgata TaxID=6465 RepID=UPI00217FAF3E|nr:neprilysin-4 [Patella vulgata]
MVRETYVVQPGGGVSGKGCTDREKIFVFLTIVFALLSIALIIVLALELTEDHYYSGDPESRTCMAIECVKDSAALLNSIDFSVNPCDDFYEYSCGNWIKNHIIPEDKSSFKRFEDTRDKVDLMLKALLETPISKTESNATKKAKWLYKSCSNEEVIDQRGLDPLGPLFKDLGGWPIITPQWDGRNFDIENLLIKLHQLNTDYLLKVTVRPDERNSSKNAIVLDQGSLGLPSKDYYLKDRDDKYISVYEQLARDLARMFGAESRLAASETREMIDLEIKLANYTSAIASRRDRNKLYNKMTVAQLRRDIPWFDWNRLLNGVFRDVDIPIPDWTPIVVYTPEYLKNMVRLVRNTSSRTVANYLIWRLLKDRLSDLPEGYRAVARNYNRVVFGIKREQPRWKMCAEYVKNTLGHAVGRMFVERYFDESSKDKSEVMIKYVEKAFNEMLMEAEWMDKTTKEYALKKADNIIKKIAYPDWILDNYYLNKEYQKVNYNPDYYFENVVASLKFLTKKNLLQLRESVNKTKWTTTPAVVNAYYQTTENAITFPAGILQPPFYSKHYPMSLVFGGIGMVIGHEITHGFDDEGRQFDDQGNLRQWWTRESQRKFTELAQCMIDQYSNYSVNGEYVRGNQTVGENIADNGGVKAAYRAYHEWKEAEEFQYGRLPGLNLTANQLFFVNFAQVWCAVTSPEADRNQLLTDSHSPGAYRVIGSLSNNEDFSKVFECPLGSRMNPVKKCKVW